MRCNLKLGISVTQIWVRCQESKNMAASESIYSPTVYRDFLSTLFVQTVLHKDMQWETGTHNGEVCDCSTFTFK